MEFSARARRTDGRADGGTDRRRDHVIIATMDGGGRGGRTRVARNSRAAFTQPVAEMTERIQPRGSGAGGRRPLSLSRS